MKKEFLNFLKKPVGIFHADEISGKVPSVSEQLFLSPEQGTAPFTAQFQIKIKVRYFTENAGAYTSITQAAMVAAVPALDTPLAAFIFGQSDFASGYRKASQVFPVQTWSYGVPFIYGRDYARTFFSAIDATVAAQLQKGDIVLPFYYDAATNYVGLVIISMQAAGNATLVDSLSSDRFWINKLRYDLPDTSAPRLLQYDNALKFMSQSLFGLYSENEINPTANKSPMQYQNGIIDLNIAQGVDKNVILGTYINSNSIDQTISINVRAFDRLRA